MSDTYAHDEDPDDVVGTDQDLGTPEDSDDDILSPGSTATGAGTTEADDR